MPGLPQGGGRESKAHHKGPCPKSNLHGHQAEQAIPLLHHEAYVSDVTIGGVTHGLALVVLAVALSDVVVAEFHVCPLSAWDETIIASTTLL